MSGLSWSSTAAARHADEPATSTETLHPEPHRAGGHDLPRPTIWPAALAAGIALMAAGLTTSHFVTAGGGILFVLALRGWVRDLMGDPYGGGTAEPVERQADGEPSPDVALASESAPGTAAGRQRHA